VPTANEELFDDVIRHQIGLRRFTSREIREILKLLKQADDDLLDLIQRRLRVLSDGPIPETGSRTLERLEALLKEVRELRKKAMAELATKVAQDMRDMSVAEGALEAAVLTQAIPISIELARIPASTLRALVNARPFQGRFLRDWFLGLEQRDRRAVETAIRLGVIEGETTDQIVRRVRGTRANGFKDGALSITRRNAEAITRTAVTHYSNAARNEVWKANSDVIEGLRWTATLDGRTSAVCRGRDGRVFPVDRGPRPPAHVNCRSVMVPILDGVGVLGKRPTVVDTRTRARREVDFRAEARKRGVPIQQVRREWADSVIGRVPAETTYEQFLRRQSKGFQDDVLGDKKGTLFRKGELPLDRFVDGSGREFGLDELRRREPAAWARAFGDE
jgi:SPP1 gp7 family putative phage head morphogenesis protein